MPPRTNSTDVINASGTLLSPTLVDDFIADAHVYVETRLSGKGIGEDALTSIEKYLSAHYAAARDETLRIHSEKTGQGNATFEEKDQLRFLKRAAALDPTGTIAEDFGLDSAGTEVVFETGRATRGASFSPRW